MFKGIKAVAFDIDGTLYAQWKLYVRMPLFFLRHLYFYSHYGILRKRLRQQEPVEDFYDWQADRLAAQMGVTKQKAFALIDSVCYRGLSSYFDHIKPYPGVVEAVRDFKAAGLKIAILSDFPPSQKGSIWGIRDMCDVCLGSEECGMLKPSAHSFTVLAQKLGVAPGDVLYVGNSVAYDVLGASGAGMRTAYLLTGFRRLTGRGVAQADISFKTYRQLRDIVLQ